MEDLVVKLVETEEELRAAHAVRMRVFVQEQGVPEEEEVDEYDELPWVSGVPGAEATHVVAMVGGVTVGAGRVVCPVTPAAAEQAEARIGRMAVDWAWRRRGIGSGVLEKLEEVAGLRGADQAVLHAQTYVKSFYAAHGYVEEGRVFLEAGIEHVQMRKRL